MDATHPPSPRRLHELDGLRAVATLLVLAHHSVSPGILRALEARGHAALGALLFSTTASGVELFFVLSGVVLLRPYVRGDRPLDTVTYLRRRVERIAPPYLAAWILAGAVVAVVGLRPTWFAETLPPFRWGLWLSQAFILRFQPVLFNDAWWSLAVEVLFYLCVPLVVLVWGARRFDLRRGLAWFLALIVVSTLVPRLVTVTRPPWSMPCSLLAYASCFCGGILIARFDLPRRAAPILCCAGVIWVVASALLPLNVHVGYGLLYTGVVQRLVAGRGDGVLASPPFVWLGERSYSLFLVHVSVFQLTNALAAYVWSSKTGQYFLVTRLVGLPAAFLVAMTLFSAVERRFARGLVTADAFWPPLRLPARRGATVRPAHAVR
jgi:peptidoglycan/LPS O-acetylase OafA/YrhL